MPDSMIVLSSIQSLTSSVKSMLESAGQFLTHMLLSITEHSNPNTMLITALIIIALTGLIGGILAKK